MPQQPSADDVQVATRRGFLQQFGQTACTGAVVAALRGGPTARAAESDKAPSGRMGYRVLGKTGLRVSEIGFGGHSWNFAKVPDGRGGLRRVNLDEAQRMIALGLEMGVNFFDSCTPLEEHSVPGEVIHRLRKRDEIIVSARLCHKMKGVPEDRAIIERWVEERLRLWQTDRFDILMLTNTENDTPRSGYWDMSYSLETVDKLKRQGKVRFAGFGCHFTPQWFREAFAQFGRQWDVCSVPYNVRHRGAEELLPEAEKLGLGIVTIKAFARGELLQDRDLAGAEAGLARDMIAFVLENPWVDCCICGVHSESHVRENFSASWTKLTPPARQRLETLAACRPCRDLAWVENGWLGARSQVC
jgi:aryl-alcohol dehydrogenase-like predicted oxidoreductase